MVASVVSTVLSEASALGFSSWSFFLPFITSTATMAATRITAATARATAEVPLMPFFRSGSLGCSEAASSGAASSAGVASSAGTASSAAGASWGSSVAASSRGASSAEGSTAAGWSVSSFPQAGQTVCPSSISPPQYLQVFINKFLFLPGDLPRESIILPSLPRLCRECKGNIDCLHFEAMCGKNPTILPQTFVLVPVDKRCGLL